MFLDGTILQNGVLRVNTGNGDRVVTFQVSLTNHGRITIGSTGNGSNTLSVVNGPLTNHGTINMSDSRLGPKTILAEIINETNGLIDMTVGGSLNINKPDAHHVNRGTIQLTAAGMSVTQSGTDPSFTLEAGTIATAGNNNVGINGGAFEYLGGTIQGGGWLQLNSVNMYGNEFTNTVNFDVAGASAVDADIVNQGMVTCTSNAASPLFNGRFHNDTNGLLRVSTGNSSSNYRFAHPEGLKNDGTITIGSTGNGGNTLSVVNGPLTNHGTINMSDSRLGPKTILAEIINETNGLIDMTVGGSLNINKPDAHHVNRGTIQLTAAGMSVTQSGTDPSFTLDTGTIATGSGLLTVSGGVFDHRDGAFTGSQSLQLNNVTLHGFGEMSTTVNMQSGRVSPGDPSGAPNGELTVTGSFSHTGAGSINIDISGPPGPGVGADQFSVTGAMTYSGPVDVFVNGGYLPTPNDVYEIVTYASHSGSFAPINAPCPAGRRLEATSGVTMLSLEVFDPAGDTNCDCAVDAFDIEPFIVGLVDPVGYATRYPDCDINNVDCNRDGAIDAFDIEAFINILLGP